jgi:hypothetical protein
MTSRDKALTVEIRDGSMLLRSKVVGWRDWCSVMLAKPRLGKSSQGSFKLRSPRSSSMRILTALVGTCLIAGSAAAQGNIVVTGHDDDFHWSSDGIGAAPGIQINAFMTYARRGSSLPVLAFDHGTEMTAALTALGIPFTRVDPDVAANITDAMFSRSTYSAFAVASDNSCGGCDNDATGEANIALHTTAIGSFLNSGGGIVAFAGANASGYYGFLPQTPSSVGGAPSTVSPPAAVTMVCNLCTVAGGVIGGGTTTVPINPAALLLIGIGLLVVTFWMMKQPREA